MPASTISVPTPDGPMDLYEALPDAGDEPRGAVVVIQEAFGVNEHIQDVTRRFAAEGYHAVAPHLFHRAGGGTVPYGDFAKVLPFYQDLDDSKVLMDVDAALGYLRTSGPWTDRQIGIVGFCFGGRVTFLVAVRRALGAGVGFYGGGIVTARFPQFPALVDEAAGLQTPWLGLFGDLDQSIPVDDVERLRTELDEKAASVDHAVVRYPHAGHGFHCNARDSYHRESAVDGWQRTLAWFVSHLEKQ